MQVIDRAKERLYAKSKEETEREKARRARDLIIAEESKPKEFYIDRSTWQVFLMTLQNGAIAHAYGNEMSCGAFYLPDQIQVVNQFMKLAIRDRNYLESLVIDDANSHYLNIPLSLPTEPETIDTLTREARNLGIDYLTYLRAIFISRVEEIKQKHELLEKERIDRERDQAPVKVYGFIHADLRKKLEKKFGPPVCSNQFGIPIDWYGNRLIDVAEEYFVLKPTRELKV